MKRRPHIGLYLWTLAVLVSGACSLDDGINIQPYRSQPVPNHYLKEYYEDDNLVQSFEYEGTRLLRQWLYRGNNVSSIEFVYSEQGRADSARVRQTYFPRDLAFRYRDSLLMEFEVWNNRILRQWVLFDRDEKGRIVEMKRISLSLGFLLHVEFEWEGGNIARYESTFFGDLGTTTWVYEFRYDTFRNPYRSVFHEIGFNFVDYMPLTENNWLELVVYRKDDPNGSRVTYKNTFSYGGDYPFVKESVQIDHKDRLKVYAEYKY